MKQLNGTDLCAGVPAFAGSRKQLLSHPRLFPAPLEGVKQVQAEGNFGGQLVESGAEEDKDSI